MATRDVVTRLSVRDDLTPALTKASSAADKLATSSEKAARSATGLDKASGAARQMEGALKGAATSAGRLGSASKDIDKVSTQMERANRSAGMLKAGIAGLAGGLAIGGLDSLASGLGGAMTAASDLNETLNKSQAIFGTQADAMAKWGDSAATSLGMSKSAALEAAASFGDMFSQLGFAGDAAAGMSRQVVQMSADLGSFNNLPTADVADRISAAFRGEYDSLQLLIPNISAARVEQQAMAMTGEASAKALTAQEKAAAVLAIVQQDGARAMGDFARTSQDAANAQKVAQAQAADLAAEIGQNLLPAWTAALKVANTTILPALSTLASSAGSAVSAVAGLPAPIQAVGAAFLAWKVAGPAIQGLTAAASGPVVGQFRSLATAVSMAGMASQVAGGGFTGAAAGLRALTGQASVGGAAMSGLKAAGSGLLGVLGGPWGIAFAGAAAAVGFFMQRQQEAKAVTSAFASAVESDLGRVGEASRKAVAQQLEASGALKELQAAGVDLGMATDAVLGNADAWWKVVGQIDAATASQSRLVADGQGGVIEIGNNYTGLRDTLGGLKDTFGEAYLSAERTNLAIGGTGAAAGSAAPPVKTMADSLASLPVSLAGTASAAGASKVKLDDWAAGVNQAGLNVKELDTALQKLMGAFSVEAATDAWSASLRELGATLKGVNGDLDANSAAGEKVRGAMRNQVSAGIELITKMAEQGASTSELSAKADKLAADIERTGDKAGVSKTEMQRYTQKLREVPKEVKTNLAIGGMTEAQAALGRLTSKLNAFERKTFTATLRVMTSGMSPFAAAMAAASARGNLIESYARGDVRDRHVAQMAKAGAYRVWAERETGGESYIPHANDSRRPRALQIWAETGKILGVDGFAAGGLVKGYAGGGLTRGGFSISDKGLVVPIIADVQKVIPPTAAVPLAFDLNPADSAMLRGPELVSLLTGIDLPELDPAVKKVRDNYTRLIGILSSQVKDQAQLNEAVRKAQDDVTKARQGYASAVSGAASGATTAASTAVKGKASGALASSKAKPYLPQILAMGAKYGVAPELIAAVMQAESGFNPNAGSSAGARGLMQLMPGTFRGLGVNGRITDPNANIEAGTKYLSQMLAKVGGDVEKALRAYNAGPGAIAKSYKYKETNAYVAKIGRDAGVKSLAGSGRYGSSAVAGLNSTTDAKRAGEAIAKSQTQAAAVMKKTVAQKTSPDTARAIAIQNALGMVGRGSYVWGGGHSANYYKNKAALNADCSGFVGWAVGNAVGKNVTGVSRTMLGGKAPNWVKIDPKLAAKVAGAALGSKGHIVMSMGDGTVTESYSKGKPVRRRKITARDMQMAAWNTNLGPMTIGTAADITRGVRGTVVRGATGSSSTSSKTDPAAARQALADAEKALKLAQQEAQLNQRRAKATEGLKNELAKLMPVMEPLAVSYREAGEEAAKYGAELQKLKDDQENFADSVAGSVSALGSIVSAMSSDTSINGSVGGLGAVLGAREQAIKDATSFKASINQLKALGLNAADLGELINAGVEKGGTYAERLAREGAAGVAALNDSRAKLDEVAVGIGKDFAGHMYDDQVAAKESVVGYWQTEQKNLEKVMTDLGSGMATKFRDAFGLKEFAGDVFDQMLAQWYASLGVTAPTKGAAPRAPAQPLRLAAPQVTVTAPNVMAIVELDGQRLDARTRVVVENVITGKVQEARVKAGGAVR